MRARLPFAVLSLVLALGPAAAQDAQDDQLQCAGVFGPDSTEALVRQTFGDANVVTGIVPGPEGTEMLATTVFGDDPARRMAFGWFDEENLSRLNYVDLAPDQIGPGGVRIGMSVADVEALNQEPFAVGGFWWDYGGYANIETGALAGEQEGGCYLSIRFSPGDDYPADLDVTAVAGEVQVSSAEPLLQRLDTRVQVVSIGYPWPDDLPQPQY